jgi:TonB family protein
MTENWTGWESLVIHGRLPLRRYLGESDHSVVFLTEHAAGVSGQAAIKLVPADGAVAEARVAQWRTNATLSHPNLLRLFDAGRCEIGGHPFAYAVMEYAQESLRQVLASRPLTPQELRETLVPTLRALGHLHEQMLVQCGLKPQNLLVVGDELKLASDTVRPVGTAGGRIANPCVYDAPEVRNGTVSSAGDIWGVGALIVESLTQAPPQFRTDPIGAVVLPETLPPYLAGIARRCLRTDPRSRPTLAALEQEFTAAPPIVARANPRSTVVTSVATPGLPSPTAAPGAPPPAEPQQWFKPVLPPIRPTAAQITLVAAVGVIGWAGWHAYHRPPAVGQIAPAPAATASARLDDPFPHNGVEGTGANTAGASPDAPAPEAPPRETVTPPAAVAAPLPPPPPRAPQAPLADANGVLHGEIPRPPHSALATIHGTIKISVSVSVDGDGKVIGVRLAAPGPSSYFAHQALEAASHWRFTPDRGARIRMLRFEFTRGGVTGTADASTR